MFASANLLAFCRDVDYLANHPWVAQQYVIPDPKVGDTLIMDYKGFLYATTLVQVGDGKTSLAVNSVLPYATRQANTPYPLPGLITGVLTCSIFTFGRTETLTDYRHLVKTILVCAGDQTEKIRAVRVRNMLINLCFQKSGAPALLTTAATFSEMMSWYCPPSLDNVGRVARFRVNRAKTQASKKHQQCRDLLDRLAAQSEPTGYLPERLPALEKCLHMLAEMVAARLRPEEQWVVQHWLAITLGRLRLTSLHTPLSVAVAPLMPVLDCCV